jgi:hypothetical protein
VATSSVEGAGGNRARARAGRRSPGTGWGGDEVVGHGGSRVVVEEVTVHGGGHQTRWRWASDGGGGVCGAQCCWARESETRPLGCGRARGYGFS